MWKKILGFLFVLIIVISGIKFFAKYTNENHILYENKDLGIGFLIPKGYSNNPFKIEEKIQEYSTVINFLEPNSEALVFTIYYMDKDYWEKEVKDNFSVSYTEIYKDDNTIILCVNVSDIQYDINDDKQREKYFKLFELRDEICESLYFIK